MKLFALFLFLGSTLVLADKVKYSGYKVFRITPQNENEVQVLRELENLGLSFWNGPNPPHRSSDVLVPPHLLDVVNSVRSKGLEVSEFISDVQSVIDETSVVTKTDSKAFDFTQYHTFEDIVTFLNELATNHSEIASTFSIGGSYEGRELLVLKIAKPSESPKRAIWVDSSIHATEWITSAVSVYIINEMLNGSNPIFLELVENFDWYFLPIHNPDGFVFTHTNDRLWRKTRSDTSSASCKGVDPNRNWDFEWLTGGSSTDPCSNYYAGPNPFSEPETNYTSQFINQIATSLDAFISIHCYSQLILIPYGVTNIEFPGHGVHMEVGLRAAEAIRQKFGTLFTPGNTVDLMYVASGGSADWAAGVQNIPWTYTFELRDQGAYGFLLPPEQIVPSAQELLDGLAVIADAIHAGTSSFEKQ